jgi:hypothetical protein
MLLGIFESKKCTYNNKIPHHCVHRFVYNGNIFFPHQLNQRLEVWGRHGGSLDFFDSFYRAQ